MGAEDPKETSVFGSYAPLIAFNKSLWGKTLHLLAHFAVDAISTNTDFTSVSRSICTLDQHRIAAIKNSGYALVHKDFLFVLQLIV